MAEQQLEWARQALADSKDMPAYLIENIKKEIERLIKLTQNYDTQTN